MYVFVKVYESFEKPPEIAELVERLSEEAHVKQWRAWIMVWDMVADGVLRYVNGRLFIE